MSSPIAAVKTVSPRVRLAAQLYATGAAKSKREASELAGLHPNYLTMMSNGNEPTKRLISDIESRILDESVDSASILKTLGRKGLARIAQLMNSGDEKVALVAAKDLADRSPETQKTQRLEVATLSLGSEDAKSLAAALVESAKNRAKYLHIANDGLDEVKIDQVYTPPVLQLPAGNGQKK